VSRSKIPTSPFRYISSPIVSSFLRRALGRARRVVVVELLLFIRWRSEGDSPVERNCFDLDVEAFAVSVLPCTPDSGPDGIPVLSVTHLECVMSGCV